MLTKAFIPYKGYYSSPFARWQGSMANEHSIVLAGGTAKRWFSGKNWDPTMFDYLILGYTIPQIHGFYGSPWAAALIGAPDIPGVVISQACTTATTCVFQAGAGIENGLYEKVCCLMADRNSNSAHLVWPNPPGPGGQPISESFLMDAFNHDPWAKNAMIQTAENVAKESGITREECDALTLRRYEQYMMSFADDKAFKKQYMFPVEVKISNKKSILIEDDEGVTPSTQEGLGSLRTVFPDGIHTFGSQTHPADGNASITVTTREKARELSEDSNIEIQIVSYGYSRAKKGYMAMAVVPAVQMALEKAGIGINDVKAIKTHNPFAANDLFMAKQLDIEVNSFNNYGCSMVFGHPVSPTVGRLMIEGIEEVAMMGGGYLLVGGCAAGDTGAAIVLKIA